MAKYTAINIGPIIGTISLAKRPRELWAASYLFSFFMECIINEIVKTKAKIISPALLTSVKDIKKQWDFILIVYLWKANVRMVLMLRK